MAQHYEEISYEGIPELAHYRTRYHAGWRKVLAGLGQINLFVGPNNAGKSRFMRGLFKRAGYTHLPSGFPLADIRMALRHLETVMGDHMPQGVISFGHVKRGMLDPLIPNENLLPAEGDFLGSVRAELKKIIDNQTFSPQFQGGRTQPSDQQLRDVHSRFASEARNCLAQLEPLKVDVGSEPHVYVPILRGLRELKPGQNVYLDRTIKDYELALEPNRTVAFTGLGLYERLKELLLGDREHRTLVRDYEDFLSSEYFDGADVQLVPKGKSDVVHVVIGNDVEKPIYELGDGLQSIITITFPMFTADKRSLFFVEEPEVHLHPGMQRRLVESMRSERFCHHQVFLTTHSNHLLDVAGEYGACSTYLFRPDGGLSAFTIHSVEGKDSRVLRTLGARSSSMYLSNAIIWVEGITDRLYLREFLHKYLAAHPAPRPLKEDTHFVLAEVGGANVVHWKFDESAVELGKRINAVSLCADNFLVLDGDNAEKGTRKEDFERALGQRFALLADKEIENLLPIEAVHAGVRAVAGREVPDAYMAKLTSHGYQGAGVGLGEYLDKTIPAYQFGTGTGTLRRKVEFCYAAVEHMRRNDSWTLSPEATRLCERLVAFILEANGEERCKNAKA